MTEDSHETGHTTLNSESMVLGWINSRLSVIGLLTPVFCPLLYET